MNAQAVADTARPGSFRGDGFFSRRRGGLAVLGTAVLALITVGLSAAFLLTHHQATAPVARVLTDGHAVVGGSAPDFETRGLDGSSIRLSKLRGQAVILNFWATWCVPCQSEMPALAAAQRRYGAGGLEVVGINYYETSTGAMKDFARRAGADFKLGLDPQGKIADAYGVTMGLPVSVLIDRAGRVVQVHVGQMSASLIDSQARTLVGR